MLQRQDSGPKSAGKLLIHSVDGRHMSRNPITTAASTKANPQARCSPGNASHSPIAPVRMAVTKAGVRAQRRPRSSPTATAASPAASTTK